uniref:Uncharacterized protein n=1 Tax=Avena sativa TaxID=4498 RepID=A0ACD5VA15_AVESA
MKAGRNLVSGGAAAAWLLGLVLVLVVLQTDFLQQITHFTVASITHVSDEMAYKVSSSVSEITRKQQQQLVEVAKSKAPVGMPNTTDSVADAPPSLTSSDEIGSHVVDGIKDLKHENEFLAMDGQIDGSMQNSDVAAPRSKLTCNFSSRHMDICAMEGDIRMHGKSATVYVLAASNDSYWPENGTVTIRPFPRKHEVSTMAKVQEVTIRSSAPVGTTPPRCTVTHDVPAVVFSTGPDSGNFFHGMSDMVIPLYITTREYNGRVQLVVIDYNHKWISRYRDVLAALSIYPVINLDIDNAVRCFPSVHVGIEYHDTLGINPALSRNGYTMMDFLGFLRSVYSLKRPWVTPVNLSFGQRPRLVMILRGYSRVLTNEAEAITAATEVGFEVVAAGPEVVKDITQFAQVVNTCDVIVGVHGAGLTNMVFLPHNGTVMQIIPWGEMKWPCWATFGYPSPGMGLRYVEYEATAEETTLKDVYPKDHAVFADPLSLHKSFDDMYKYFLDGQNVTLDIDRFTGDIKKIYQSITIT